MLGSENFVEVLLYFTFKDFALFGIKRLIGDCLLHFDDFKT